LSSAAGARFLVAMLACLPVSNDEGLLATTGAWAQAATVAAVSATANQREALPMPVRRLCSRPRKM
jgi:hypothetical protein